MPPRKKAPPPKPDASQRLGVPKDVLVPADKIAANIDKLKRSVGRPSLYMPEYCDAVIELGAQGHSLNSIAHLLGVLRDNLLDWADRHPEFSTALKKAKMAEQYWWEETGKAGMFMDKFNATIWRTSMQARFRQDYTERKITEVTGEGGGPVQIQPVRLDVEALSHEAREELRAALMKARLPVIEHQEDEDETD